MQWKGRGGKQISEAKGRQMGTNNEVNGVNEVVSGGWGKYFAAEE